MLKFDLRAFPEVMNAALVVSASPEAADGFSLFCSGHLNPRQRFKILH